MKSKKYFIVAGTALMLGAIMPAPVMAAEYQTDVVSSVKTGDISVHIQDYEVEENGKETVYQDNKQILPGQTISKITRIVNEGNAAWVRIKPEWKGDEALGLSLDMIGEISGDWKQIGEYFYCTKPLGEGESVDFGKTIHFPEGWTESTAEKTFYLYTQADAVQEANFTPDWGSEDPWFGTVIEQCSHTVHPVSGKGSEQFSVSFEGGAEGLVRVGEDFFSNFGNLMPGDKLSETVKIGNNYGKKVAIYFSAENIDDADILKKINLEIRNADEIIYSGPMSKSIDKKLLGTYSKGDTSDFTFTVSLPAELTNESALQSAKIKWTFIAEVKSSGGSSGGGGSHSGSKSDTDHGPGVTPTEPSKPEPATPSNPQPDLPFDIKVPDTGDHFMYGAGLVLIGALGIAAFAVKKSKEDEEENSDDEKGDN